MRTKATRLLEAADGGSTDQAPRRARTATRPARPRSSHFFASRLTLGIPSSRPGITALEGGGWLGQSTQRRGHDTRVAALLLRQHGDEAKFGGALGADELFEPRRGARHDQRRLIEGQDLAKGVIAAHRDDTGSARHERFEPGIEGNGVDVRQPRGSGRKSRPLLGQHERAEDNQRRKRQFAIVLIGRQHQIDEHIAVAATARGDQQKLILDELLQVRRHRQIGRGALQIAGIDHTPANAGRHREPGERVADLRQAINPDLVVVFGQRRDRILALPFALERFGIVHHVAQPKDHRRPPALHQLQCVAHLAAQPQGLLVDDQQVGVENIGGMADDRRAHRQRLLDVDMEAERDVLAVAQLDDAGYAHKINTGTKIEAADDRRPRQDQDGQRGIRLDQRMGNRAAAAQMTEAKTVVAVNQHTPLMTPTGHLRPLAHACGSTIA